MTTSVTSSLNPSNVGQSVTFTATVTPILDRLLELGMLEPRHAATEPELLSAGVTE